MSTERVQKILAQAGITSRRKAEELIVEGLVTINGAVAKLGDKAEWGKDSIKVKGKLLHHSENKVYIALNKPKGVISSLFDPEGRPTLADFLDKVRERVFPVGRLDFNSEGLILLTNDGEVMEKIQKEGNIPRVYSVKVKGYPDEPMMERLRKGARFGHLKKKAVAPLSVRITEKLQSKSIIEIVMIGSGAFDIKALFETKGFRVERVVRTGIGQITLRSLQPGHFRLLKASQIQALLNQPELGLRLLKHAKEKNTVAPAAAKKIAVKINLSPRRRE